MDEIERRIKAARPPSGHRNLPLTDRAERELADLMRGGSTHVASHRPRRRSLRRAVVGVAAAAVLAVAVPVTSLFTPPPAAAGTPKPLEWTPTSASIEMLITDAVSRLRLADGPAEPLREVESLLWYYAQVDPGESGLFISPEVSTLVWDENLSGRQTVVAGVSYWADDPELSSPPDAPRPGQILRTEEWGPGEFSTPFPDTPGTTDDDFEELWRSSGLPRGNDAHGYLNFVRHLLKDWTLTNAQQARLLSWAHSMRGLHVLGTSVDRGGRPIVGLATRDETGVAEERMFLSLDTGRVIGFETYLTRADGGLPAGSVFSYILYDLDEN